MEVNGTEYLSFKLLDKKHPEYNGLEIRTTVFKEKRIRNSFGQAEDRYRVKLKIRLFGKIFNTFFTLTDRKKMNYPLLLGKTFLSGKFLVDVSLNNISYQQKIKNKS